MIIDASDLDDDTTQASGHSFTPPEEPTSPTLSLATQSASAREVNHLFLAKRLPLDAHARERAHRARRQ